MNLTHWPRQAGKTALAAQAALPTRDGVWLLVRFRPNPADRRRVAIGLPPIGLGKPVYRWFPGVQLASSWRDTPPARWPPAWNQP